MAPPAPVRTTALAMPEPAADPVARREAERLAAMMSDLAADRDRLSARVASLEEQLADVTGSVARQQAALASREAREAAASRERVAGPPDIPILTPPVGMSLGADVVFAPETVASLPDSSQPPAENAASRQDPPPDQLKWDTAKAEAVAPAEPTAPAAPPAGTPPPESARAQDAAPADPAPLVDVPLPRMRTAAVPSAPHAVDLGGAFSRQTVADRWGELKVKFAPQLRGLRPLVGHVNRFGYAPYRLVVGPLADEAAARQLCARLSDKINCLPTRFTGDRLAQP
jgi:hypothetical protein